MDSLTHIVIGACIGDLVAGKKIGKRAMLYGALLQSIPDIDFIASFWLDPVNDLVAHRGITHSLLFAVCVTPILAFVAKRLRHKNDLSYPFWNLFFISEILIHLFLDSFNAYGTGWLEPFNHVRVSFHAIFVADPLFSIFPGIAFLVLLIKRWDDPSRRKWAYASLIFCFAYLLISLFNKDHVDKDVRHIAHSKHITADYFLSTPTPLNNMLWFVAIPSGNGFYVGYRSVFDRSNNMELRYVARNDSLLDQFPDTTSVKLLKQFSQGYYTAERYSNDTLVINDLRFGQEAGWESLDNHFAFHYYLNYPKENVLVVQRGRFARWNKHSIALMWKKIKGE
ncbi:MAG TPA: metal-dependent hydrolase [Flavitalea sp.]|nr:metal-dependent hydrolase [Flavitalea sp.]